MREIISQSVTMWRAGRSALLQGRKFLDKVIFQIDFWKSSCLIDLKQGKANAKKAMPGSGGHSFDFWKKVFKPKSHTIQRRSKVMS